MVPAGVHGGVLSADGVLKTQEEKESQPESSGVLSFEKASLAAEIAE